MAIDREMRYVVRRLNWQRAGRGRFARLPGWTDLAGYHTPTEAEADRRAREAETRAAINPFDCVGSVYELSSLPGPMLADWLMDGGLEPPPPTAPLAEWRRWWADAAAGLAPDQVAHAWAGFDKLRFYEAAERPAGGVVHVVLQARWEHDEEGDSYRAIYPGGDPVAAFQTSAAAEARRRGVASENGRLWSQWDPYYPPRYIESPERRDPIPDLVSTSVDAPRRAARVFAPGDAPYAEVSTVPVAGTAVGADHVFLVQRLAWAFEAGQECSGWAGRSLEGGQDGMPVVAYLDRRAAEVTAWELDFVARLYLNPFRFGHPQTLSSVNEAGFRSLLWDVGLNLPVDDWGWGNWSPSDQAKWIGWWDGTADQLSAAQRDLAWDLLDQLRFHAVVELPLEG